MITLRYTLLSDGSSDAALMPIIEWLIAQHRPEIGVLGQAAEGLGAIGLSLSKRIPAALRLYPCDVLFVHRDAEGVPFGARLDEIVAAVGTSHNQFITIIPVRMTEAWLFSDETAIRSAAANQAGKIDLKLPAKKSWESMPDPKQFLFDVLELASEKSGRALSKFKPQRQRHLVAQRSGDFSALRGLASFDFFESQLVEILGKI